MKNLIVTLTGPSCAGKSTLEGYLKTRGFENVISTTTRPMREGEENGKSYHFIDKSQFKRLHEQRAFVETVDFNGNYYGVSALEIERVFATGSPVVVVVEPSGMKQIKDYAERRDWRVFSVFVSNPDSVIAERFLSRFLGDINDSRISDKAFGSYVSRLATMMTTERCWSIEAFMDSDLYDLRLSSFDKYNTAAVVDIICDIAGMPTEIAKEKAA